MSETPTATIDSPFGVVKIVATNDQALIASFIAPNPTSQTRNLWEFIVPFRLSYSTSAFHAGDLKGRKLSSSTDYRHLGGMDFEAWRRFKNNITSTLTPLINDWAKNNVSVLVEAERAEARRNIERARRKIRSYEHEIARQRSEIDRLALVGYPDGVIDIIENVFDDDANDGSVDER